MNNWNFVFFVAAGTFLGNFLVYGIQGNFSKGAIVGLIAAILLLCTYCAAHYITYGKFSDPQ